MPDFADPKARPDLDSRNDSIRTCLQENRRPDPDPDFVLRDLDERIWNLHQKQETPFMSPIDQAHMRSLWCLRIYRLQILEGEGHEAFFDRIIGDLRKLHIKPKPTTYFFWEEALLNPTQQKGKPTMTDSTSNTKIDYTPSPQPMNTTIVTKHPQDQS